MARKPRQPSPFKVHHVEHTARPLVTTSDPPLGVDYTLPPIVRVKPEPEHDEEHVRNVREAWEEMGAHVRVLPREREAVEHTAPSTDQWEMAPVRDVVMAVAAEVKSGDHGALTVRLTETMTRAGL